MKHILFNNATSVAGSGTTDYASVTDDQIALFNVDTGTSVALTSAFTGSRFTLVQGGDTPIYTPILEKANVERVRQVTYSASTAQVTALGGFPNPTAGEEYTIKVVDVTNGYEPYPVQSVSVTATDSTTIASLLSDLANAINNHPRNLVTAVATPTTLTLTGSVPSLATQEGIHTDAAPLAQSFSTSLSLNLDGVTITSAAPTFGSGSYEQVRYLEENTQGGQGFLYRMTPFQAEKPVFFADPALTYDLVSILYRTNTTPNISSSNKYVEYILAYEAGTLSTATVDWTTVLG